MERRIVERTAGELRGLIDDGFRLLIVHGNGPQVGRLMRDDVSGENFVYLDECNGYDGPDGYAYHATMTFPFFQSCYRDAPSSSVNGAQP